MSLSSRFYFKYSRKNIFLDLFVSFFMLFLSLLCFFSDTEFLQSQNFDIKYICIGLLVVFIIFLFIFPRKSNQALMQKNKYLLCLIESILFILITIVAFILPGLKINKALFGDFFGINNSIASIFLIHGLIHLYVFNFNQKKISISYFSLNLLFFALGMHFINDPYQLDERILKMLLLVLGFLCVWYFFSFLYKIHYRNKVNN